MAIMRAVFSSFSALFCVLAIAFVFTGQPRWMGMIAVGLAGLCFAFSLYLNYQSKQQGPIVLDDGQKAEIKKLLAEGKFGTAVNQVKLWYRNVSTDEAQSTVRELDNA